jgi:hypothetical protein
VISAWQWPARLAFAGGVCRTSSPLTSQALEPLMGSLLTDRTFGCGTPGGEGWAPPARGDHAELVCLTVAQVMMLVGSPHPSYWRYPSYWRFATYRHEHGDQDGSAAHNCQTHHCHDHGGSAVKVDPDPDEQSRK